MRKSSLHPETLTVDSFSTSAGNALHAPTLVAICNTDTQALSACTCSGTCVHEYCN